MLVAFIKGRYSESRYTIGRRSENKHTYIGGRLDVETGLYYYRHRTYDAQLGRFVSRDPVGYEDGVCNLYEYVRCNPIAAADPGGAKELDTVITGPCHIWIYAGHGIWQIWGEDRDAKHFRESHDVRTNIVSGCGNYLGLIGCRANELNAKIHEGRRIPKFPDIGGPLEATDMLGSIQKALKAAKDLAAVLCENRAKFFDDGTPERYRCGTEMQRCDSVEITVSCDADAAFLMRRGIYRLRLWPGDRVRRRWHVDGLPTKESKTICKFHKIIRCCDEDEEGKERSKE